jgi:nitroreductase
MEENMFEHITQEHEQFFDDVISSRRSVRAFRPVPIEKDQIEKIIRAGIIAPFAAIPTAGRDDFRRFIVIATSSEKFNALATMIDTKITVFATKIAQRYGEHPYVKAIQQAAKVGTQAIVGKAPDVLIVGEKKGIPDNAAESLSYCMHNIWLKATSLRIGFRLLAILSQLDLENDEAFCDMLGIESKTYALSTCALGYPENAFIPPAVNYPNYEKSVVFFE